MNAVAVRLGGLLLLGVARMATAADTVVVLDVTGTWERLSAPGRKLICRQELPVKDKIRFVTSKPFVPGSLVLADSNGTPYFTQTCKLSDVCEGVFEVPAPTASVKPSHPFLQAVFKVLIAFINEDHTGFVNAIGNTRPTQAGSLNDAVLPLKNKSLDLCDTLGAMSSGRYHVELSAPGSASPLAADLTWAGQCPAPIPAPALTPGVYTLRSTDSAGIQDVSYVLVCSPDKYDEARKGFNQISTDTDDWIHTGGDTVPVQSSARRTVLVGYLYWTARNWSSDPGRM